MPAAEEMPGWLPAAEKAMGTMLAMPSPASAKASVASSGEGAIPAPSIPAAATAPDSRMVATAPSRLRTLSPRKRIKAMAPEKAVKARLASASPAPIS